MRVNVQDGTVVHSGRSLCGTCCHSTVIRGRSLDEEIVECHISGLQGRRIPFSVTSCTSYADARLPSYMDMVRTAWVLNPYRTKRRAAGFVRGDELSPLELAEIAANAPGGPIR